MSSGRNKTSTLWMYFTCLDEAKKIARCDLCGLRMSFRSTITNFRTHITRKHPTVNLKVEKQNSAITSETAINIASSDVPRQEKPRELPLPDNSNIECETILQPLAEPGSSLMIKPKVTNTNAIQSNISHFIPKKISINQQKKLNKLLIKLITDDLQPFSVVEDSAFKSFITALNPSYTLPSRKIISNNLLPAAYEESRTIIFNKMKTVSKVCLTTDCWTSAANDSYLALTAHFINDDFEQESVLLDCILMEGSHTSVALATKIKQITDEYDLTNKVLLVVSDNAANIVGAVVNELKWKHLGCYAHGINLIVQEALRKVHDLQEKARNIVTFFKRSSLATGKLMKFQRDSGITDPKKLVQDVITRWNSTYLMFQRLVLLQDAVKISLALSDKDGINLTPEEWKMSEELTKVLKPFYDVTKTMSGESYVTGSQIIVLTEGLLYVCSLLSKKPFNEKVLEVVSQLHQGLNNRFHNIQYHRAASICTFLDPRFKQFAFTSESSRSSVKKVITELAVKEFNDRSSEQGKEDNDDDDDDEVSPVKRSKSSEENDELSVYMHIDRVMEKQKLQQNPTSGAITEITRYMQENVIPRNRHPLKWWSKNHHSFPTLTTLVKQRCVMVATSVPCERIFSKAGAILEDRRTRLKPSKVRQIIFLNANGKYL